MFVRRTSPFITFTMNVTYVISMISEIFILRKIDFSYTKRKLYLKMFCWTSLQYMEIIISYNKSYNYLEIIQLTEVFG